MTKKRLSITADTDIPAFQNTIGEILQNGMPADATVTYTGRNILFTFPATTPSGPVTVNTKSFRLPRFPNNYIYAMFRPGKAERSHLHAHRLLDMGFLTPEPFGFGTTTEYHLGIPTLTSSYYFCRHLPYPNMRGWEVRPDYDRFVTALGAEIARLHKAGVWMKDFSAGNILCHTREDGEYQFLYVDLNRIEFNVTSRRKLMQMFKTLSTDRTHTLRVAEAYAKAAGLDAGLICRQAGAAFDSYNSRVRRKKRLKSLFRKGNA